MSVAEDASALPRQSQSSALLISAFVAFEFALTIAVFFPGVMSEDARYLYDDIARGFRGDWQSPVMAVLWSIIDPIAPGTASMFLLIVTIYWLAFGIFAFALARRSVALAFVLLLLALSPPALVFLSMVWRDVPFAGSWLLAAVLCVRRARRRAATSHSAPRAMPAGLRCSSSPERAARCAASHGLYCVARTLFSEAGRSHFSASRRSTRRAAADCLLHRARRGAATHRAVDHGLRPWRHHSFCPGEPIPGVVVYSAGRSPHDRLLSPE